MVSERAGVLPEVAVGLIVADGGELLLQHRDDRADVAGAGLWGFFGGHVEPGERPSGAFLREMREELGWTPSHFEHYLTAEVEGADGRTRLRSHAFAAHLDVPVEALVLGEGQAMRLVAPDALPDATVVSARPVIAEFAASDAYRRVRRAWDLISVTALLVDADGRFLLQLRDDRPDIVNPGLWGSFGGRVEPHETPQVETPDEALVRELREELAWTPPLFRLHSAGPYRSIAAADPRLQLIYVYAAPVDVPLDAMTLGEGQEMSSFAPGALPERIVPALRTLIERFTTDALYGEMIAAAGGG